MPSEPISTRNATLLGLGAVALWSGLAALTALAGPIPPFQLSAMTFALGTLVGSAWARARGLPLASLVSLPPSALLLGIYGLLAFHVCYFFALQRAPAIEASLVIYLWPLLIVLFSGLLPARLGGRALRWWHVGGALLGLIGTVLILVSRGSGGLAFGGHLDGYLMAAAAAVIWSSYSVASRLFAAVPGTSVIASCGATTIGAALLHALLEPTVWPASPLAWAAVAGLGLGPVGLAFYLWDEGMKRGDIRLLGVASYATPLLSTLLLAWLGLGKASATIWVAAMLITVGALLASRDMLSAKRKPPGSSDPGG